MRLVDAHCHLSDIRYEGRLVEVFARAAEVGVDAFILGGVEPAEWARQRALIKATPAALFSCFGLHPWIVDAHFENGALLEEALRQLPTFLSDAQCVALGELGLDHGPKRNALSRSRQLEVFQRQLELSEAFKKPLVLHIVHAHDEALECLKRKKTSWGGLVHAFSGSFETATRYLDLGFTISVGGGITRPGYESLKRALKKLPLDRLVIESDSPDFKPADYLSVIPGLNDPGSLPLIAATLATLRTEPAKEILEMSRRNLIQLFQLNGLDTGAQVR